ncbi:putative aTP-binding/permease protein CydC [Escherichia coli]|nr:putative aTP-binding/permease protein CydC [Escherichia coli]
MRALLPYLALYKRHKWMLSLGIVLAIVTLLASIGLLTLSGWFLSASAVAGVAGLYSFNYMLPAAGVRGAAITRTAGRYFERLVSHDATFRVLQHLRIYTFSKLLPSPLQDWRAIVRANYSTAWWRMLIRSIIFTCALSRRW